MKNILIESLDSYTSNAKLVLLFSIPFIIAFLIPMLAPLPTYISGGAIFLRTASLFANNLSAFGIAVIIVSLFFSLLFISFAIVAIALVIKSQKTHTRISERIMSSVERYIGKVFVLLLFYLLAVLFANVIGYMVNAQQWLTPLVGFLLFLLIFYAPGSIVIGEKRIANAVRESISLLFRQPGYVALWLIAIVVAVSLLDYAIVHVTGTVAGAYIMLLANSLLVLPYFVIMQIESYMRKFALLKH